MLLNDAVACGDASRIAAFFRNFQQEAGNPTSSALPNRARTASSGNKPTLARRSRHSTSNIARAYVPAEKPSGTGMEADIFAAQREGRVQGPDYLTK